MTACLTRLTFATALVLSSAGDAAGQQESAGLPPDQTFDSLFWLSGCWASVNGEPGSGEMWTAPAGGALFGVSRTVRNGRVVAHEFMMIRELDEGIAFIAHPSDQEQASFSLISLGERKAAFENPEHDFPQRVIYRSANPDELVGRIEGVRAGVLRAIDFPMKRTQCP